MAGPGFQRLRPECISCQQADKPSTSLDPRLRGDDDHWGIPDNR